MMLWHFTALTGISLIACGLRTAARAATGPDDDDLGLIPASATLLVLTGGCLAITGAAGVIWSLHFPEVSG